MNTIKNASLFISFSFSGNVRMLSALAWHTMGYHAWVCVCLCWNDQLHYRITWSMFLPSVSHNWINILWKILHFRLFSGCIRTCWHWRILGHNDYDRGHENCIAVKGYSSETNLCPCTKLLGDYILLYDYTPSWRLAPHSGANLGILDYSFQRQEWSTMVIIKLSYHFQFRNGTKHLKGSKHDKRLYYLYSIPVCKTKNLMSSGTLWKKIWFFLQFSSFFCGLSCLVLNSMRNGSIEGDFKLFILIIFIRVRVMGFLLDIQFVKLAKTSKEKKTLSVFCSSIQTSKCCRLLSLYLAAQSAL